jgi:hypothetical protein
MRYRVDGLIAGDDCDVSDGAARVEAGCLNYRLRAIAVIAMRHTRDYHQQHPRLLFVEALRRQNFAAHFLTEAAVPG